MLETCLGEVVSEIAELLSTKKRLEERSGKVQAKMGVNSSRLQVRPGAVVRGGAEGLLRAAGAARGRDAKRGRGGWVWMARGCGRSAGAVRGACVGALRLGDSSSCSRSRTQAAAQELAAAGLGQLH